MSTPFFGTGNSGDGVRSRVRIASQPAPGVPAVTGALDLSYYGGPMSIGRSHIDKEIFSTGEMSAPLEGPYVLGDSTLALGDINPADPGQLSAIASYFGARTTTNPGGAHYRHVIGVSESTALARERTVWSDNNTGRRPRHVDCIAKGWQVEAQTGDNFRLAVTFARGAFDDWDDGTQVAGTGSTVPRIRRNRVANAFATTADVIRLKVTDATGAGQIKTTIGAGGSYLGAAIQLVADKWVYLNDGTAANAPMGKRSEQVQVLSQTGATLVVDDVFEYTRRGPWVQSLPLQRPIAVVQVRLYLDGEEITADGVTITADQSGVAQRPGSGAQPAGTQAKGNRSYTVNITRQLTDMTAQVALLKGSTLSLVVEGIGDDLIGATSAFYGVHIVVPAMRHTGQTWEPDEGGEGGTETITCRVDKPVAGFTSALPGLAGLTFTDALSWVVDTSVTVIS